MTVEPPTYDQALNPSQLTEWVNKTSDALSPIGLVMVHKLLDARDIQRRLQVPLHTAKQILNAHGDIKVSRYWRMSEERYRECLKNRNFKTRV